MRSEKGNGLQGCRDKYDGNDTSGAAVFDCYGW